MEPEKVSPSASNPGTFWYAEGRYYKLSESVEPTWFDALARLMRLLIDGGYSLPIGDVGIVSYDRDGRVSETPYLR